MPFSKEYIVTKTVGYDFDETNFDFKDEVSTFLKEIFPGNDIYEYMITTLSSCSDGQNRDHV